MRNTFVLFLGLVLGSLCYPAGLSARQVDMASGVSGVPGTNANVLVGLAMQCTSTVLTGPDSLVFTPPSRLPFLRSALVNVWQEAGKQVFVPGSQDGLTSVELGLENAGVDYARNGRGNVLRTVRLALSVRVTGTDGRILHDEVCNRSAEDLVAANRVALLEDEAYPETRAELPLSFWRRIVHPAAVGTATVVGTVLFFSLRSRRSTDG